MVGTFSTSSPQEPDIFERSPNTERALAAPRPRTRGLSHRIAALLAAPAAVWLIAAAPPGRPRVAAAVFGLGILAMFTASALVHLRPWPPMMTEVLFRLDNSGILLAIAGTATPIALFALTGWQQDLLLYGVWGGSVLGLAFIWWPRATPRGSANAIFVTLGALTVPLLPWILENTGWTTVTLMLAGGLIYLLGAVVVWIRRPDPAPEIFGYHEIWHVAVIAAVAIHYVMVARLVLPGA